MAERIIVLRQGNHPVLMERQPISLTRHPLPVPATPRSAGLDLKATEYAAIPAGGRALTNTSPLSASGWRRRCGRWQMIWATQGSSSRQLLLACAAIEAGIQPIE